MAGVRRGGAEAPHPPQQFAVLWAALVLFQNVKEQGVAYGTAFGRSVCPWANSKESSG